MKKTTKRIDAATLEGKAPMAEGYKIFNWDWTGYDGYCYADEDGEVEGSVHTVTGKLDKCGWGLHYSVNPIDCMRYEDLIQWNKFAKVEAYDEDINAGDKSLCRTMKIVKVLSFDEMIEAIKEHQKGVLSDGYGISDGSGISNGYGIRNGYGIYKSKFCTKCEGISRCICCYDTSGKLMIFNKPVSEERFNEVWNNLGYWYPNFTNAEILKEKHGEGEWKNTPAVAIEGRSAREAYAEMPDELREYIKSLPEFDADIWAKITEAE